MRAAAALQRVPPTCWRVACLSCFSWASSHQPLLTSQCLKRTTGSRARHATISSRVRYLQRHAQKHYITCSTQTGVGTPVRRQREAHRGLCTILLSERTWMSHLTWSGGRCGTTSPQSALGSRPAAQSHALHALHSTLHVHLHHPRVLLAAHTRRLCRRCRHLQARRAGTATIWSA
jgi:hypothetical protein